MIEAEKIKAFEKIDLTTGSHASFEKGACIMEMVSYLANEPWSDHPECSCKALTAFAIRLNDRGDDAMRAKLKALAPRLIGTRDRFTKDRANFFVIRAITVMLPILTDALDLKEISAKLREFKIGEWIRAKNYINSVRPNIREAAKNYAYADADAAAAAAAAAAADAAAAAAADAAADAAAAAYAAAYAAAAAAAYAAADAAAAAAAENPKGKAFWLKIRKDTFNAMYESLEMAMRFAGLNANVVEAAHQNTNRNMPLEPGILEGLLRQ